MGIFGDYCNGTIKNLAVVNSQLITNFAGIIVSRFGGVAENVYMEGSYSATLTSQVDLFASSHSSVSASLKNVVCVLTTFEATGSVTDTLGVVAGQSSTTKLTNVIGIGANTVSTAITTYADVAAFTEENVDVSWATGDYWTVVDGVPTFKTQA